MANIFDTLDSLLTLNLDKRASQGERDGAQLAFERKCKRADVDPISYKKSFVKKKEDEERRIKERDEAAKRRHAGSSQNTGRQRQSDAGGYNDAFWEEFFRGAGFGGFGGQDDDDNPFGNFHNAGYDHRRQQKQYNNENERRRQEAERQRRDQQRRHQEQEANKRREEERKRKEKEKKDRERRAKLFPADTIRNIRYRLEKAKFSWASIMECERFVEGDWIPYRLVLFSNKFEFPKGYRDMMFIYESNGKQYYRGYTNVCRLYLYENGIKILIFDESDERADRTTPNETPRPDGHDIHSFEWETKAYEFQVAYSEWYAKGPDISITDLKNDLSAILMENPKIAPETIIFEHISYDVSNRKPIVIVKITVKYKRTR